MSHKNNKANEYPVIYSYIYERESEDIKRLAGKFSNVKKASASKNSSGSAIRGFKIEGDKAVPIYSENSEEDSSAVNQAKAPVSNRNKSFKEKKDLIIKKSAAVKRKN